jgi:large subunit ribosomal protein L44
MGHVSKRLYSSASKLAVSTSQLKQFPPKEAILRPDSGKPNFFDPESWATLQPPPTSALTAFAHRIGLANVLSSADVVRRACTHKSFVNLHAKYYPSSPTPPTNANLATLGNALMGLFASEHLHAAYPHLPTRVLKAAVSAHVGPLTCASVAQEMGAVPLLRWHRQVECCMFTVYAFCHSLNILAYDTNVSSTAALGCISINTEGNNCPRLPRNVTPICTEICPVIFLE